ncbi:energy-coupling factor transporter transmembrane component T family protein [Natranaerobius trueperi]|uniref:Cobalt ECF transporter T component CbiQ n=1 Tax=Natranaerobius trueperi TaxID=759412 RepID=A0A226BZ04_9FIRM|nr:energy-coupling factor transporter transmembrane component T [Natranaerobius trueperi]OWZ84155.1 hypothetical protein CDO51_04610 [Natranaerobius trueperi]
MKLNYFDYLANTESFLHKRSTWVKFLVTHLYFAAIFYSESLSSLLLITIIILINLLLTRISLKYLVLLTLYPIIFASFYLLVFSHELGWVVIIRAIASVFNVLLLFSTAPITEIIALLKPVVPQLLIDIIFLTYRVFFIMLYRFHLVFKSMRVRGGYNPKKLVTNLKHVGSAIGLSIIQSVDLSERLYAIMAIRGYRSGFMGSTTKGFYSYNLYSIITAVITLFLAVML